MTSKLKEARETAGYTIEQVAAVLKIRKQYVIDLEEEDFRNIPGEIYVNGYTKIYHEFLGLELHDDNGHTIVKPREAKAVSVVKQKLVILTSLLMLVALVGIYAFLKN